MNQQSISGSTPMEGVGHDISEADNRNLAQKRMKRGECPTCGTKTHKVNFFGKKTALTVEGQALYGRCLICNPVEGYSRRPPEQTQPLVPQSLEITEREEEDDAGTMVSGITLDYRLVQGARQWDSGVPEDDDDDADTYQDMDKFQNAPKNRPEPSICEEEDNDDWRPTNRRGPPPPRRPGSGHGGRPSPSRVSRAPQFGMGVIEEKDTVTETSSGGNRDSEGSGERNSSRDHRNRYQSSPEVQSSSYDMGRDSNRGDQFEEDDEQSPNDYEEEEAAYDDRQYSNEDARNTPSQGARGRSSRGFNAETTRRDSDSRGSKKQASRHDDTEGSREREPQDSHDVEFNSRSSSQRAHPSKTPSSQVKKDPRDDRSSSHRSRDESRGSRSKDDDGHSLYSSQGRSGRAKKNRPPKDDGSRRRKGRGMPDDDNLDGPVARPTPTSSKSVRGRKKEAAGSVGKDRVKTMFRELSQTGDRSQKQQVSLDEVQTIIACLNLPESTSLLRERAFEALAEIIWESGQQAKESVVEHKGIEALVQSMWQDMSNSAVQTTAVELMFALSASTDGVADKDVMTEMNAEGAVDALLISMQTHLGVEGVQRSGCSALCCLAAASSDNQNVNDGTLSGAVLSVVNAMGGGQQDSLAVQEWGIRALYNQCVYSANADSNKASLGMGRYDGGNSVDVIHRAIDLSKSELVVVEWACRLYWCLSANDEIARSLVSSNQHLQAIVNVLRCHDRNPDAGSLAEAAYGTLANLARFDQSHDALRNAGVTALAVNSMKFFSNEEGVNVEGCTLLANLAAIPEEKDNILRASAVKPIVRTMDIFPNNEVLQEEALRALLSLSIDSEEGKMAVSFEEGIKAIVQALEYHRESLGVLENACSLMASLGARQEILRQIVLQGGIHAIAQAMNANAAERRLQEVACAALRNLSYLDGDIEDLLDEANVGALVRAMDAHPDSGEVQLHACCVLWNLCTKSQKDPETVVAVGGVKSIVTVMQSHMESALILEMACGALWSILNTSHDRKANAVENGGIDAVTCALVMHPRETGCLKNGFGVLSSVSVESVHAEAIANAQGISIVVEAMRSNGTNTAALEFGSLVLRNIVLVKSDCAEEASSAISTIVTCMQENPDASGLQKEACNALWALAAQSESCKARILALDGVTVIMNTLDRSSDYDVQEAARGAFNQLAMPSFG